MTILVLHSECASYADALAATFSIQFVPHCPLFYSCLGRGFFGTGATARQIDLRLVNTVTDGQTVGQLQVEFHHAVAVA